MHPSKYCLKSLWVDSIFTSQYGEVMDASRYVTNYCHLPQIKTYKAFLTFLSHQPYTTSKQTILFFVKIADLLILSTTY